MLNKVVLMGRLTADPELRRTPSNNAVTSFTLAVNRDYVRPGEQRGTDFIDCLAWSKTAEFVSKWFIKGLQVAVTGRLQVRNWEDKQGQKRKAVEVIVEDAYFADSKKEAQTSAGRGEYADVDIDDGDLPF